VKALGIIDVRETRVEIGLAGAVPTGTVSAETAVTTGRLVWTDGVVSVGRVGGVDAVDCVAGVEGKSIFI
jgi:hypothetical protein